MWARVVECMLGCWMAVSPFIFSRDGSSLMWAADFAAATLVILLALLSYWPPTRYAHLAILLVAMLMIGYGRFGGGEEVGPGYQNHILVGLLLLMFALVPNHASEPPTAVKHQHSST